MAGPDGASGPTAQRIGREAEDAEEGPEPAPVAAAEEDEPALQRFQTAKSCQPARPQVVGGTDVWPEYWGLEKRQIAELLRRLRDEEGWDAGNNVYTLVNDYIIPWTRGAGVGYALQLNGDAPKEVTLMVSHAWGENAEAFLEALLRSSKEEDVLFVCALSIYQPEDGFGPSIHQQLGSDPSESPFRRVLEHIRAKGLAAGCRWRPCLLRAVPEVLLVSSIVLFYVPILLASCVPAFEECATQLARANNNWEGLMMEVQGHSTWRWVSLEPQWRYCMPLSISLMVIMLLWKLALYRLDTYNGRMVVVPNREVDIYSRLWCVYEIFVALRLGVPVEMARSLAFAGMAKVKDAGCSSERDAARIRMEIEEEGYSYDYIDKAVFLVTHRARMELLRTLFTYGVRVAVTNVAFLCMSNRQEKIWQDIIFMILGFLVGINCVYGVYQGAQGRPSFHRVLLCGLLLCLVSTILFLASIALTTSALQSASWALFLIGADTMALAIIGVCCCTDCAIQRYRNYVLPFCAFCALVLLQLKGSMDWRFYPELVQNATFILSYVWAPALVWWTAALQWGVTIDFGYPSWTCTAAARRAVAKRRCRTSSA